MLAKNFALPDLVRTWDEPVKRPLNMQRDDDRMPFSFPAAQPLPAGVLRESALHRYAQHCNLVRGRLLIRFLNQSVNT